MAQVLAPRFEALRPSAYRVAQVDYGIPEVMRVGVGYSGVFYVRQID
jgi:hypothetical protein